MNNAFDPRPVAQEQVHWSERAACRNQPPEWFFPTAHGPNARKQAQRGIEICRTCPVVAECRKDGRYQQGVWGARLQGAKDTRATYEAPRLMAPHGTSAAQRRHQRRGEPLCDLCSSRRYL